MRPQDRPGVLAELVSELPHDLPLRAAKIHTANDGTLVLDTFVFGDAGSARLDVRSPTRRRSWRDIIAYAPGGERRLVQRRRVDRAHFGRCSATSMCSRSRRCGFCKHLATLPPDVSGTDGADRHALRAGDRTAIRVPHRGGGRETRLTPPDAGTNRDATGAREDQHPSRLPRRARRRRATARSRLLGFVVQAPDGRTDRRRTSSPCGRQVHVAICGATSGSITERPADSRTAHPAIEFVQRGRKIITALCDLVAPGAREAESSMRSRSHRILSSGVQRNLRAVRRRSRNCCMDRFNPDGRALRRRIPSRRTRELSNRRSRTTVDLEDSPTAVLRTRCSTPSHAVLRTNVYLPRVATAWECGLDPAFLVTPERPELPYGVFYVHGRGFNGFHVRFRDIARGGLRVVLHAAARNSTPWSRSGSTTRPTTSPSRSS